MKDTFDVCNDFWWISWEIVCINYYLCYENISTLYFLFNINLNV
jgi:hypothetical protein